MKKFLKIFIVMLLVLGVIGGTCYFFFLDLKKKNSTTPSVAEYLASVNKSTFDADLIRVKSIMNDNSNDKRFDLIVVTSGKLDNMMASVSSYYVSSNTQINNKEIFNSFNDVKSSRALLQNMMNEYQRKSENSTYFDKTLGANDMYLQACNYLMSYAQLIRLVQESLSVNRNSCVKFNLFDVYTNVVAQTFSKTNIDQLRTAPLVVDNDANLDIMNRNIDFDGLSLKLTNPASSIANNFDKYYSQCSKADFALNLSSNVAIVNNANQSTNEKIATYYLKAILGL